MKWRGRRGSSNVEDRRGVPVRGAVGGGVGMLAVVIVALLLGVDPSAIIGGGGGVGGGLDAGDRGVGDPAPGQQRGEFGAPADEGGQFAAVVLADTEDTWNQIFAAGGGDYPEPTLVLFEGAVASACGTARSAVGPFYCPRDQQVYVDLGFFRELSQRFGASGDFARAYVIAHEVGHHVQNLTGAMEGFAGYAGGSGPGSAAVRMELQADCYAGLWAHDQRERGVLDPGDIEEALNAASAIGDDALQRQSQGTVVPETFTHGTSEQRARWFQVGYDSGDPDRCNTFDARSL